MTRALALGLWVAIVGAFAGVVVSGAASEDGEGTPVAFAVFVLSFATTGALVAARRPRNPIGWILLGAAASYSIGGLTITQHGRPEDEAALVRWISTWVWMAGIGPVATFGLLLFPDGRLPSPAWRPVAWLAGVANGLVVAGIALQPGRFEDSTIENPVGLAAAPGVPDAMEGLGLLALAIAVAASIVSLFARHRRARSVERAQLKWLSFAGASVGVAALTATAIETAFGDRTADLSNAIISLALAAVPLAMGVAILRHRLYDVDLVIRRTLVYAGLTATLAAAYLGLVLLAGLAVGESDVAIAGSTLAVAALFRPARGRIQAVVDRRFYRRRYDAARILEAFSAHLRDELDLDALGGDLRAVVRDTVAPAHLSLWLRSPR